MRQNLTSLKGLPDLAILKILCKFWQTDIRDGFVIRHLQAIYFIHSFCAVLVALCKFLVMNQRQWLVVFVVYFLLSDDTTICHPKWVEKDGIRYHTNNYYLITGSDDFDPVFSRIIDVLVASGNMLLFQVQLCSVNYYDEHFHSYVVSELPCVVSVVSVEDLCSAQFNYYDEHFHSYVVSELPCVSVVSVEDLCSPFVLHGHSLFNGNKNIYITLRHSFISMHE